MITSRSYCTGTAALEMSVRMAFGEFEVLSHCDIKPAAVRLLEHRFPHVPNLGDMRAINYADLEPADMMIGSWPCQAHSAAGKRLGEADPRDLWPEYLRAIRETRPKVFFGENVARIASNGELRRVVRSLADLGYVGAWRCVRASDDGACHRRDRCFVVAVDASAVGLGLGNEPGRRGGTGREGPGAAGHDGAQGSLQRLTLLPTSAADGRRGGFDPKRASRPDSGGSTLPEAIMSLLPMAKATDGTKGGPGMRGSSGDLMLPSAVMQLLPTPCARDWREGSDFVARPEKIKLAHTVKGYDLAVDRWGVYAAAIARHERALGRPAPEPTQLSPRSGKPQLSARFVEWMMMLPDGWVCDVPDLVDSPRKSARNAMLSLLGDGVVPTQGAYAFRFLLEHIAARLVGGEAAS